MAPDLCNGHRFETPEQRAAHGWPADRPDKHVRKKGRGVTTGTGTGHERSPPTEITNDTSQRGTSVGERGCRVASGEGGEQRRHSGKRYVVLLTSGLANRLRTLLGFKLVASLTNGELLVRWEPGVCNCPSPCCLQAVHYVWPITPSSRRSSRVDVCYV